MARIEKAVREILEAIGEDPDRDGLRPHARTGWRDMYDEIFAGLREDPDQHLHVTFEADHDEMVMVRDIPLYSLCEHHLIPFIGKAHVAYIPNDDGRITGLSKLARLVDVYASGPRCRSGSRPRSPTTIERVLAAPGRARGHRGRAPLHVDARGPQARRHHGHLGRARPVPRQIRATRAEAMRFIHGR